MTLPSIILLVLPLCASVPLCEIYPPPERYDSLESGGRAAGAGAEQWYRKAVGSYGPLSRKWKSED